jgi:hypothetical protein
MFRGENEKDYRGSDQRRFGYADRESHHVMNETMSESQLLWLVADKAEQCAAHDAGLAVLLRALAAVSGGSGKDHVDKIVRVAQSAEGSAASLRGFITSTRIRAVALEAQAPRHQTRG